LCRVSDAWQSSRGSIRQFQADYGFEGRDECVWVINSVCSRSIYVEVRKAVREWFAGVQRTAKHLDRYRKLEKSKEEISPYRRIR
jgi:hypothetical protein